MDGANKSSEVHRDQRKVSMIVLGKTEREKAEGFVRVFVTAKLWSMSSDGKCRVATSAKGNELSAQREEFARIATSIPRPESLPVLVEEPIIPCQHRGSKRKTCCNSPSLWICRELNRDCVATIEDAARLSAIVATNEAATIAVCQSCPHRNLRVGFVSAAYMEIGGTETFHRTLLPRLRDVVNVTGFVATAFHGGDGSLLQVPYDTGIDSAKRLASNCDVLVVWGISNLAKILPANGPRVIAVHHADWSSEWNNGVILSQLHLIDEVVCVNQDTAENLRSRGKPVHYIPNAIDPARIQPSGRQSELRARHSIAADAKIVLFGHRLSAEKRPLLAVQVAQHLPEDWVMVIAGDGSERKMVESAACSRVRIVGACDSLADWLAVSSCFLSLSTFEGFGLAIGEAMAAGIPTVSTPAGIAQGLATTLPVHSTAAEWAHAINTVKVIAPASSVLERFSVQRMVDAWAKILKSLIP